MSYQPNYPATIAEVIDPPVRFRPSVIAAVEQFAASKPYRGTLEERMQKFQRVHAALCWIYGSTTRLRFGLIDGGDSGSSYFSPAANEIMLVGKLSVVTYLHEFAHALGRDERGAVRWSLNLFRRCFPQSFERAVADGHMLRREQSGGPPD